MRFSHTMTLGQPVSAAGTDAMEGGRGPMWRWNRKFAGRTFIWLIPLVMIIWFSYQLADLYTSKAAHQDASRMLFEASSFQMELMSRYLSEAKGIQLSSQLEKLTSAVYSASYVHERFARAFPEGQVDRLESLEKIMQYVLQLQIGGDRPLKEEELAKLQRLEPIFSELAAAYAKLMSDNGKLNRYESGLIRELDNRLLEVLKE